MQDILIICNHHRRSLFFEETMKILYDAGLKNIFILETGNKSFGLYQGPASGVDFQKNISHDVSMVYFKNKRLEDTGCEYILRIDSDFFIDDANFILDLIEEANNGKYDFVSALKKGNSQEEYDFSKGLIQPVLNQKIVPTKEYPYFCPVPHYEAFCAIWSMNLWEKISQDGFSHGRKLYKEVFENNAKIGVYYTDYIGKSSQVFNGYIHLSDIMTSYYALERKNNNFLISNLSRLGYFFAQERIYGLDIYPQNIQENLIDLYPYKQPALDAWDKLTVNTCMQSYYYPNVNRNFLYE